MSRFLSNDTLRRVAPFVVFMLFLVLRGNWPESVAFDTRWVYGLSVLVVGGMLLYWHREYGELAKANAPNLREVAVSIGVGLGVFVLWIQLDAPWMTLAEPSAQFLPIDLQGGLIWPLIAMRWVGAALLVPVMEELFWRSYLMRWIQSPQFASTDPQKVGLKAIVLSTFVFVLAHTLWLAAAMAGFAYALLYVRTGKLWTAVIAHAVTNGALGIWVITQGQWQFW